MTVRLSPYVPPRETTVARQLWGGATYARGLLQHAERWGVDRVRAWAENDRLELTLPLAILRGAPMGAVVDVAASWWLAALEELGGFEALGWSRDDRSCAESCVLAAIAPDVSVAALADLRGQAIGLAGRQSEGRGRYHLLTAAAHLGGLGVARVRRPTGAMADGEGLAEHLLEALREASARGGLFGPNVDAWTEAQIALAHARMDETASVEDAAE